MADINEDYVCEKCGGNNIEVDATARWDVGRQDWVVEQALNNDYCYDCGEEVDADFKPVDDLKGIMEVVLAQRILRMEVRAQEMFALIEQHCAHDPVAQRIIADVNQTEEQADG